MIRYDKQYIMDRVIITDDGCWEWQRSISSDGYGSMNAKSCGEHSAHRLSYKIFKGEIPPNKIVCHTCDYRLCCNPDHLFLGWHSDNANDAFSKGRRSMDAVQATTAARRIPQHIIEEAIALSNQGDHYETIAQKLNISRTTAHKITSNN